MVRATLCTYINKTIKNRSLPVSKIISGGQTGADRAAHDFALDRGIEIGGWVPRGRLAEDGIIGGRYLNLKETEKKDPASRTGLNIRDSDATLILSHGNLTGGSKLTKELAQKYSKPFLHIDLLSKPLETAVAQTRVWIISIGCRTLNIAGPRASIDQMIYEKAKLFLTKLFD